LKLRRPVSSTQVRTVQYTIAGILVDIGVVLWVVTVLVNRATGQAAVEPLTGEADMRGPVN